MLAEANIKVRLLESNAGRSESDSILQELKMMGQGRNEYAKDDFRYI